MVFFMMGGKLSRLDDRRKALRRFFAVAFTRARSKA
jgi:hypothetical protein